jgi:IS5 family transposase
MALSIVDAVATIKRNVAACLSAHSIQRICTEENYRCRVRELGPVTTLHAFLLQVLHGNTACSQVVRLASLNCTAEAYCQARARIPLNVYQRLLDETGRAARHSCTTPRWHGHRTFLIDGSSFSMPDTDELREHFGQPGQQAAGCGFPVAHWLTMFDAQSGLLVRQLATPLRTHDLSQVSQLHPELAAGDVLVGDTAFASYVHLALLLQTQLHGVFPVHQRQLVSFRQDRKLVGQRPKGTVAIEAASRLVRKLAKYDQVVEYAKPQTRPTWISRGAYRALPETIVVRELRYFTKLRGGRTRLVTLVTTLIDADQYPAAAVAELYGQRWQIETNLASLKTIMRMDVLRCKTVAGVRKELAIFALVYNLVRLVMCKAAKQKQVRAQRVSFVDALRWLAEACRQPALPLRLVLNPYRPGRHQPRAKKRRPKEYDLLTVPRWQLRERLYAKRVKA